MDVFKEAWEKQLQVLTEAVDDITGIEDFLATTGEPPWMISKINLSLQNTTNTLSSRKEMRKKKIIGKENIVVRYNGVFYICFTLTHIFKLKY